jgi:hypothetical protein
MKIVVHIPEVVKSLDDYEFSHNAPTIDLEAILDYICNEYMFGTSKINNVLLECLESLSNVRDCDHCDVTYNKLVSEIYNLIITVYRRLDEYMLREYPLDMFNNLRLVRRWRDLYVFELK